MATKVLAVIPAKNEALRLPSVIPPIIRQGVEPVIVVEDGSTDNTARVASELGAEVITCMDFNIKGRLHIPEVINFGLRYSLRYDPEYIFVCGGDDIISDSYIPFVLSKMDADPSIVVGAGLLAGERFFPNKPQGIRIVRRAWWEKYRVQYDVLPGWEDMLTLRAKSDGMLTKSYNEVYSTCSRKLGEHTDWVQRGAGMRLLGYGFSGICYKMWVNKRHPVRCFNLFHGFVTERRRPERWLIDYHATQHYLMRFLKGVDM